MVQGYCVIEKNAQDPSSLKGSADDTVNERLMVKQKP